jgi:hypothetical protein
MNIDILTLVVAVFSFAVFLTVHFITFRWVSPERLLRSLLLCIIAVMALPALLMIVLFILNAAHETLQAWVCAAVLAVLIQGLMSFMYVLCIFGPYETSVRMRLIREIERGGSNGISPQELSARYNARTIVDIRLQRLIGSGDIAEKGGRYTVIRKGNLFFIFDAIAGVLKRWIGR